ncbi:MAG: FAD/NAD(P)-binding protein [Myxococcales bacterium]|nr:FAD/NAD(P)-binding protein [Myxococcales bacterium]MCB9754441.1 FAD/NAD(P)-binding protein [Myxococcales bacterium]
MRVIIVGGGVAGSEAGTYLGQRAGRPLEIIEIECEPSRRFGGWGFQRFPVRETTNLATRKMYLGADPDEIFRWTRDPEARARWPAEVQDAPLHPDRPLPRCLMQEYVRWRRSQVDNPRVRFRSITGEAMRVQLEGDARVSVTLKTGARLEGERLIMASGSIAVKIPDYLQPLREHPRVIIDPLTAEGDARRGALRPGARVLILGTGLTGEEQANVLLRRGHTALTILSRHGYRHYAYPREQHNAPLELDEPPSFLAAETPEEFNQSLGEFYGRYLDAGHSPEDILAAVRPFWDELRAELGGCYKAAERLHRFRRSLAVNSIGAPATVAENVRDAEARGDVQVVRGTVERVTDRGDVFVVQLRERDASAPRELEFDHIINAVGRTIIRHPIWDQLLADGLARKHAGIGIRVSELGQMIDARGGASDRVWVVGMARAGDHALRHGYLGNTAFNVPQVRSHLYKTIDAMLERMDAGPAPA